MAENDSRRRRVQCCIVGGGPAGMMAGALLARAGVRVLVLEKHGDFLRDFRGDTVHPSTMDILDELGWLDAFLERPHQELGRVTAHIGKDQVTLADFARLPTRRKFVAFMPQWDFLDFVAQRAREYPGFDLWMKADATDLVEHKRRFVGVRGIKAGQPFEIEADLVLATDGRSSVLRDQAGLRVHDVSTPIDCLWFRLARHEDDPPQSLGWLTRQRFLVLLDRGSYWQIASIIPKGTMRAIQAAGIDAFRESVADAAPFLRGRMDELKSLDDVKLLSVKIDRLERWWRPGLLFIGDAAHAMSPVGGVGINLAIQDAVACANLLAKPLCEGTLSTRDLRRVQERRELPTQAIQAVQRVVQEHVIRRVLEGHGPVHAGTVMRTIDRFPWLQGIPARIVGMGVRPEHVAAS